MKKLFSLILLAVVSLTSFAQVKISDLPAYTGNPSGGLLPITIGGATKKYDAGNFLFSGGSYSNPSWITSLHPNKLSSAGASNGQALLWTGSQWAPGNITINYPTHTHSQSQIIGLSDSLFARLLVSDTAAMLFPYARFKALTDTSYDLRELANTKLSITDAASTYLPLSQKAAANGVAPLGSDSKVPSSYLPAITMNRPWPVASEAAMLALSSAVIGDVAIRSDTAAAFILADTDPTELANWLPLPNSLPPVSSVNGMVGSVTLFTADISESGSNYWWTAARSRAAQSLTTTGNNGPATYNSTTGATNVPEYTLAGLGGKAANDSSGLTGYATNRRLDSLAQKKVDLQIGNINAVAQTGGIHTTDSIVSDATIHGQYLHTYGVRISDGTYISNIRPSVSYTANRVIDIPDRSGKLPLLQSGDINISSQTGGIHVTDTIQTNGPVISSALIASTSNPSAQLLNLSQSGNSLTWGIGGLINNQTTTLGGIVTVAGKLTGSDSIVTSSGMRASAFVGTATNATTWASQVYNGTDNGSGTIQYMLDYNSTHGAWEAAPASRIQSFLGITGGPFLPLTGGTLSGNLNFSGNQSISWGSYSISTNTGTGNMVFDNVTSIFNGSVTIGGSISGVPLLLNSTTYSGVEYWRSGSQIGYIGSENGGGMRYNTLSDAHTFYGGDVLVSGLSGIAKIGFHQNYSGGNPGIAIYNTAGTSQISLNGNNGAIITVGSGTFGNTVTINNGSSIVGQLKLGQTQTGGKTWEFQSYTDGALYINNQGGSSVMKLDDNLATTFSGNLFVGGSVTKISGDASGNLDLGYNTGGTPTLTWYGGTTSSKFSVSNAGNGVFAGTATATAFYESSDLRLKDVLQSVSSYDNINPIRFSYKKTGQERWGYAAQEVMKVLPFAVTTGADGMYSVDYTSVFTYKIAQLEERINQLEMAAK